MNLKSAWTIVNETFDDWIEDGAARLAAAMAYYTAFAIAPLLLISIAFAGFFFSREAASEKIGQEVSHVIGPTAGMAINNMVKAASERQGAGVVATIIGVIALLFGASGVFGELQNALNAIWEVVPKPNQGFMAVLRRRFMSFAMVLGVGFLLLVSLVLSATLSALGNLIAGAHFWDSIIGHTVNFIVSFGVSTLLFALIFKIIPDARIRWSDVWIGALATAALFTIGKELLGWYLGRASTTSTFGAAGSFVAFLLWIYYSAQILFLGAEFTQVYARHFDSKVLPAEGAVSLAQGPAKADEAQPTAGVSDSRPQRPAQPLLVPQKKFVAIQTVIVDHRSEPMMARRLRVATLAMGTGAVLTFFIGLLVGARKPAMLTSAWPVARRQSAMAWYGRKFLKMAGRLIKLASSLFLRRILATR